jgi:hypothetical protein
VGISRKKRKIKKKKDTVMEFRTISLILEYSSAGV